MRERSPTTFFSLSLFATEGFCPARQRMIERFLGHIEYERRFSPLTVRNYRHDITIFDTWRRERVAAQQQNLANGTTDKEDIDPESLQPGIEHTTAEDIHQWIIHRQKHGKISPASMNRELSSLRSFFVFLRERGVIKKDIFAHIGTLKKPKHLPVSVAESHIPKVLEHTAEGATSHDFEQVRDALIVLMFYKCGIRLAELIGIDTTDISHDHTTLKVRGKGDKERIIPLVGSVRTVLDNYFDAIKGQNICKFDEKALFLTIKGERISRTRAYRTVRAALQKIGVQGKKSPHVLRHTFATQLMNAGADMRDIQELMGHSSLSSTQVYTHNSIRKLQEAYAKAHPRK